MTGDQDNHFWTDHDQNTETSRTRTRRRFLQAAAGAATLPAVGAGAASGQVSASLDLVIAVDEPNGPLRRVPEHQFEEGNRLHASVSYDALSDIRKTTIQMYAINDSGTHKIQGANEDVRNPTGAVAIEMPWNKYSEFIEDGEITFIAKAGCRVISCQVKSNKVTATQKQEEEDGGWWPF